MTEPWSDMRLSSAIASALDDICRDLERYHERQAQRLQLGRCIAAVDELIEDLEGLVRAGSAEVPAAWQARLDRIAERLPAGVACDLRSGGEPNDLLDRVFAIEARLFRLKLGEWARNYDPGPSPVRARRFRSRRRPGSGRAP